MPINETLPTEPERFVSFLHMQTAELMVGSTAVVASIIDSMVNGQSLRTVVVGTIGIVAFGDSLRRSQNFSDAVQAARINEQ